MSELRISGLAVGGLGHGSNVSLQESLWSVEHERNMTYEICMSYRVCVRASQNITLPVPHQNAAFKLANTGQAMMSKRPCQSELS